ncbi:hypothetical protein GQ55_9G424700 [Panicum hallii var. hallii]|jgi:hypothetical protein|uniref:Uncharacterized protein n=3 Tax=Panicum sect. Panicum TaxID=2100772 RepID=A0A3L6SCE6_PANMI|nr:hypothetical protein PAHAL_9G409900 [Panicum hallii]PUZ40443.1 hypothetical protein GQ55_9G424700 [Panicum hallii var. hallii]RLN17802.1 hypothetical protein C2845_PM02G21890 [Panicum miliaceum]
MLVVDLGVWFIPLTLVIVPCRRIVLLLSRLEELRRSVARRPRAATADMWSRFATLNSMAFML